MGLGTYPEIGLAEARRLAADARDLIRSGTDPIIARTVSEARDAVAEAPTFANAARQVHEALAPGFRNRKHADQWIGTLAVRVFPFLGDRRVDLLTTADFAKALGPIWLEMPETASRVRQRCERVMTWCVAHGHCAVNPVSAVDAMLPRQAGKRDRVSHHPAVPWRDLPDVVALLADPARPSAGNEALLFLILTAARSGEVRGATWSEIDLGKCLWTVPATRMKAHRAHRVPLSRQAIELLKMRAGRHPGGEWVFTTTGRAPLSDMTITKHLRTRAIPSDAAGRVATAHGFRSSFRDWASENGWPWSLAERALAHTIRNATEAAYHRTDQLEQRREMMQAWADHVLSRTSGPIS